MRILQVIHQFPPFSSQGSEVYCHQLSTRLAATDEVGVFHVSNVPNRTPARLDRGTFDGLSMYHCIDGGEYARVADWPNPFLRARFEDVLTHARPEIVHFHNYVSLGDPLVSMARRAGARVVYTLHDYGLICTNALLLRTDGQLCGKADPDFFQDCCPVLIRTNDGARPRIASRLPSLPRWRMFAAQHPHPIVRRALALGVGAATAVLGDPAVTDVARKRAFFLEATRRIFTDTDLFLAPAEFLRQRYIACGVPAGKIQFARYGMRMFTPAPRQPGQGRVRFGYIGAFHAHKGVELLIRAFEGLGDRAELHLYGSAFGSPISANYFRRISEGGQPGVVVHGAYDNRRLPEILASLDAIVVPSLWYENSPLTIQEAFIGGVPVVTSDQGGMAELVRHDVDGLHFRLGDAGSLRSALSRLIDQPALLDRFRANMPAVPDIDSQAAGVRARYEDLLARASST